MMRRDSIIQIMASIVLVISLGGAGAMVSTLESVATSAQLRYTDEASKGAPLAVTLAQSIGVIRGVMVNYLWIRADKLKEDGKFFEAYSLANWITKLQPRFAKVWQFQGWNMAYNISVATHTKEERWRWVQGGIRLIREQGLKYNPNDMMLYKELSWYFLHKIGGFTDDAHIYYKGQLAERWQGILGKPPYDASAREDRIREIVDAPRYIEDMIVDYPNMGRLVAELKANHFDLDENFLKTLEWSNAIFTSALAQRTGLAQSVSEIEDVDEIHPDARSIIEPVVRLHLVLKNPDYQEIIPILIAHVRGKVIRQNYNMDPSYMLQYMETYGPLDWRSPAAHALYWAALGVEKGLTRRGQFDFDRLNTDRLIFHSEQQLKFNGRIMYDFLTKKVSWGTDLRFIPYYENAFTVVLDREKADAFGRGPEANYWDGYRNFVIDTVREYYFWGDIENAEAQYRKLRTTPEFFQANKPDRFTREIKEFILLETEDRNTSPQVARANILGLLTTGFRRGLAAGDPDFFQERQVIARELYDYFMDEVAVPTLITAENRLGFPSWDEMLLLAFQYTMTTDQSVMLEERLELWEHQSELVADLKLRSYDQIVDSLRTTYEMQGALPLSFDEAFPPPPGIEEYRKTRQLHGPETDKDRLQIERK